MADDTAPIGLRLTADRDIEIVADSNGSGISYTSGLEAVTDVIRVVVRIFRGEWFADTDLGVPYFQNLLGKKYSQAEVLQIFRVAILQVPNVESIQKITSEFDRSARQVTVYFEVLTVFGVSADEVTF